MCSVLNWNNIGICFGDIYIFINKWNYQSNCKNENEHFIIYSMLWSYEYIYIDTVVYVFVCCNYSSGFHKCIISTQGGVRAIMIMIVISEMKIITRKYIAMLCRLNKWKKKRCFSFRFPQTHALNFHALTLAYWVGRMKQIETERKRDMYKV